MWLLRSLRFRRTSLVLAVLLLALLSLPTAAQTPGELFFDDFSDGNDDGWTQYNRFWHVRNGRYYLDGDYGRPSIYHRDGYAYTHINDATWTDYIFEFTFDTSNEPSPYNPSWGNTAHVHMPFVRFRVQAPRQSEYELWLPAPTPGIDRMTVVRVRNGQVVDLVSGPSVVRLGTNTGKVIIDGGHIQVYLNGDLAMEAVDPDPIPYGGIGLGAVWEVNAWFDDVRVTAIPFPDPTVPTKNPYNGNYYDFVDEVVDWETARSAAETRSYQGCSGHLATITSSQENNFVRSLLPPIPPSVGGVWLGASDSITEGEWQWITGEPFVYANWAPGEPNNVPSTPEGEDYLEIFSNGLWNDAPFARPYLVEYEAACLQPPTLHVSSFTAQRQAATVTLSWQTAQEVNVTGFHLYRAIAGSSEFERLTATPIPAQGDPEAGAAYQYLDHAGSGHFIYQLVSVDAGGAETPRAQAEAEVTAEERHLFVPMLQR